MPFHYKLALVLIFVGFMTRALSGNRNWLFGYRSSMSMRSHKHFDYANRIAGTSTGVFGLLYLGMLFFLERILHTEFSSFTNTIIVLGFFACLILVVEVSLRKKFKK